MNMAGETQRDIHHTRERQIETSAPKGVSVTTTPQGFTFSLSPQKELIFPLTFGVAILGIVSLVGGYSLLTSPLKEAIVSGIQLLGVVLVLGVPLLGELARMLFGSDRIILSNTTMRLVHHLFWKETEQRYEISKIHHLGVTPQSLKTQGHLSFEYASHCVTFGKDINPAEAAYVVRQIHTILDHRCHSTERIMFGALHVPDDGKLSTLRNPDVSDLTVPYICLQHINIDTKTYNFHQVERFLTYAVNYLGQEYLKNHVEVQVYGDSQELHPNIRNILTNVCRHVVEMR
jgi:hypothetical protein